MAFTFSLQSLLRLRRSIEKSEQTKLELVVREIGQRRQQLEAMKQETLATRLQFAESMIKGLSGAEVQFGAVCVSARIQREQELLQKLAELDQLRLNQQAIFQRARQQREILESLRRKQLEAYRQVQARREQQRMDELFLYIRPSAGAG